MKDFALFRNGAILLFILGAIGSLATEKAQFMLWMAHIRIPLTDYFFYYSTKMAEPPGFLICALFLWFISWKKMATVPIVGCLVIIFSFSLKLIFHHERPSLYLERLNYTGPLSVLTYPMLTGNNSFPSGHSMAAWALFTIVAAHTKKTWASILCLFLALSVSISRVYLMAHFLEDVVFGGAVGALLGYGVYYAYERSGGVKASAKPATTPTA